MNSPVTVKEMKLLDSFSERKFEAQMVSLLKSTKYLRGKYQDLQAYLKNRRSRCFPICFMRPAKPVKDIIKKENCRLIFLMDIDTKILADYQQIKYIST